MKEWVGLLFIIIFSSSNIFAQNSASATWPLSSTSSKSVITSGAIDAADENLHGTEINQYTGLNGSQRVRLAGTNNTWPANQKTQIDTAYVEFAIKPKTGVTLNITSVTMALAAASIDSMKANIYYSTDPSFINITKIEYNTSTANNHLPRNNQYIFNASINVNVNDGQTFYLRIFPWVDNFSSVTSGKYITIQNVVISGTTTGNITVYQPTLTTAAVTYVSTTSALSGGTITNDGGGAVTERGVCWNTTGSPTISDAKSSDGTGAGTYVSTLSGLSNSTKYFVRAFATNSAGTAYGNEFSFTTMNTLTVPVVSTTTVSSILVTSASSGGTITDWGGTPVTLRGICWNTSGNPTTSDGNTVDGSDIGTFLSYLSGLTKTTTYYVRAYAVNSTGIGYGDVKQFTTLAPEPDVTKIVAKDGSGNYTTVQAALNDVPLNYTGTWKIFVKKGTYKEKLVLAANKINVLLQGEYKDSTIITFDDFQGNPSNPPGYEVTTVLINANDFTARDITLQNTSYDLGQALAVKTNSDRIFFYNCNLRGYQDTFQGNGIGRIYVKNSFVEGTVDFIYGRSIMVFDSCTIKQLREGGVLTAASTEDTKFGIVFLNCKIEAVSIDFHGNTVTKFYLGRPWHVKPHVAYLYCEEPATLAPEGWTTMTDGLTPLFAEYKCTGPGFKPQSRSNFGRQLSDNEAKLYTVQNILSKSSGPFAADWIPQIITSVEEHSSIQETPKSFSLSSNYPNPFNPATTIQYNLPKSGNVSIKIYNVNGSLIDVLQDGIVSAGIHRITWNGINAKRENVASGIYICSVSFENNVRNLKLVLMK